MQEKKIFISHSTKNKDFSDLLLNYLYLLGVNKEDIFCSSNYETGVENNIPKDVVSALTTSKIDIIVLSNEYKDSEYCLNEAGIIYHKNVSNISKMMVIVLPGIIGKQQAGFISEQDIQFRLLDIEFSRKVSHRLIENLEYNNIININDKQKEEFKKIFKNNIEIYKQNLPIVENLSQISIKKKEEILTAQKNIIEMFNEGIKPKYKIPKIFYKYYHRIIDVQSCKNGNILIETITLCEIVNLSSNKYQENYSVQFPKSDPYTTFQEKNLKINNKEQKICFPKIEDVDVNNPYIVYSLKPVTVKEHSSTVIERKVIYETTISKFFQSRINRIPVADYIIKANFNQNFQEKNYFLE